MREKWIGPKDNTSGSYVDHAFCKEISVRRGGYFDAKKLYVFKSKLGEEYCITDTDVLDAIDDLIKAQDVEKLVDYLYQLVFSEFGVMEFLAELESKLAQERKSGYAEGRHAVQKEMRAVLGVR